MDKTTFKELGLDDLKRILGKTIKHDDYNKIITFLGMLLAFTEDSQFNILFNSPSSTGKSYIPIEISKLFPEKSIMKFGYCSPTAFFHDNVSNEYDNSCYVDLSRKILIFLDQPHSELLSKLRPILSHDEKVIVVKITDRNNKTGLKAKEIIIKGFPSVIYCTANSKIDEQEITRCFILSPEITREKIKQGISQAIEFESLGRNHRDEVYRDVEYQELKQRIKGIQAIFTNNVVIRDYSILEAEFNKKGNLESRDMRSAKRLVSLIKAMALLNFWFREIDKDTRTIYANEDDIKSGLELWSFVSETQNIGISPFAFDIFNKVIKPLSNSDGIERREIINKYYEVFNRSISLYTLRNEILPQLISSGLIYEEDDTKDRRKQLVFISESHKTLPATIDG